MISGRRDLQAAYQSNRVAQEYVEERFRTPLGGLLHARQVRTIRKLIRRYSLTRVLEVAPGPARLTVDLASSLQEVVLVDSSIEMLRQAKRVLGAHGQQHVRLVQGDAFHLPVQATFDLVYTFRLIRHFERPDRLRLYRALAGLLQPGGWLVFDAVNEIVSGRLRAKSAPGEYLHFDALLRPDALRHEIAEGGFEVASLVGLQRHYGVLVKLQVYVAPRSSSIARAAMAVIDRLGGEPLEWVVVCRRV